MMIVVEYGLDSEARKVVFKATGSLDPAAAPKLLEFPSLAHVPQRGDLLRWASLGEEHTFYVAERMFRFGADSLKIYLAVGVSK